MSTTIQNLILKVIVLDNLATMTKIANLDFVMIIIYAQKITQSINHAQLITIVRANNVAIMEHALIILETNAMILLQAIFVIILKIALKILTVIINSAINLINASCSLNIVITPNQDTTVHTAYVIKIQIAILIYVIFTMDNGCVQIIQLIEFIALGKLLLLHFRVWLLYYLFQC